LKNRSFGVFILAFVIIIGGIFVANILNNYNYDYLFYNERYYIITNEPVQEDQIANEVGQVKRNISIKPISGNQDWDSNLLTEGTSIYKMKSISEQEALIAKYNDKYQKISPIND